MLGALYRLVDVRTECKTADGVFETPIKDVMGVSRPRTGAAQTDRARNDELACRRCR